MHHAPSPLKQPMEKTWRASYTKALTRVTEGTWSNESDRLLTLPTSVDILGDTETDVDTASQTFVFNLWKNYSEELNIRPLLVKSVTAATLLGTADLIGQYTEKQEGPLLRMDWVRVARFTLFGLILHAPWNHYYFQMLDKFLPPTEYPFSPSNGVKLLIDQFIQTPIFTLLMFVFLGALEGKNLIAIQTVLRADYIETLVANWGLWIPATVVNLGYVTPPFRVLYINCVYFFWSIFLSLELNK